RDGPRRTAAPVARRRAPAVSHPRPVAGGAGRHLDRADADLDRAIVEGFLQSAVHLRGARGVRLLRHVLRRGAPAAPHRPGPGPAVPDLGLSGHAYRLHSVLGLARVQHGSRPARRHGHERATDRGGVAALLLETCVALTVTPLPLPASRAAAAFSPPPPSCP